MPRLKSFRVAGHFYSGMYEFDSKLAYANLPDVAEVRRDAGRGHRHRGSHGDAARSRAASPQRWPRRLGPRYEVRSWEELNRSLFGALKLEKIAMFIALTFIASGGVVLGHLERCSCW